MPLAISTRCLVWILVIAAMSRPAVAQERSRADEVRSCRQFAQEFYRWYVPFTQANLKYPASDVAIKRKPTLFESGLLRALKADAAAQNQAAGEIVGIDFDPFVGSQDPADHYEIRKTSVRGDTCLVEVWRDSPKEKPWRPDKPDVIAEISRQSGHWHFKNFRYPEVNGDLISELAWWRNARRQHQ